MQIYPDIELLDGKCVNLRRGQLDDPQVYDINPVDAAKTFVAQGAEILHIVDLDGVIQGGKHNADIICEIIESVGVPVQVAGGIRTMNTANWWFEHGADRIVIGTAAIMDRHFLREVCSHYPGKVTASVDSSMNQVMIEGWKQATTFTPLQIGKELENSGVSSIIFTDIDMDNEAVEATLAITTEMATELNIPVISSGTVKTLDDISRLQMLPNIAGAITGRALFNNKVSLTDAIAISKQTGRTAEVI